MSDWEMQAELQQPTPRKVLPAWCFIKRTLSCLVFVTIFTLILINELKSDYQKHELREHGILTLSTINNLRIEKGTKGGNRYFVDYSFTAYNHHSNRYLNAGFVPDLNLQAVQEFGRPSFLHQNPPSSYADAIRTYENTAHVSFANYQHLREGQNIPVLYDPQYPENAVLQYEISYDWWAILILSLLSIFLLQQYVRQFSCISDREGFCVWANLLSPLF